MAENDDSCTDGQWRTDPSQALASPDAGRRLRRPPNRTRSSKPSVRGGKSERPLRMQYKRLLTTHREAGLGHWSFESSSRLGWCSLPVLELIGMRSNLNGSDCEIHLRAIRNCLYPDDGRTLKRLIRQCIGGGGPFTMECRLNGLDGRMRWCCLRGDIAMAGDGRGKRLSGTAMDITEHKRSALRQDTEHAVSALFSETDSTKAVMPELLRLLAAEHGWRCGALWTRHGQVLQLTASWALPDPRLRAFLDFSRQAQQQQVCQTLAAPVLNTGNPVFLRDLGASQQFDRAAAANQAGLCCAVAIPVRAAAKTFGVIELFGGEPIELDPGFIRSAIAIGCQAGQALRCEQAEDALGASGDKLCALVHATDSYFIHDEHGHICDVNQRGCDSLGYQRDELLLLDHASVDADLSFPELQQLVNGQMPWQTVTIASRHRRRDGSLFPVEIRASSFRTEDSRPQLITVVRDVSEREALHDQMRYLASHDPLTGLSNRAMFSRDLSNALKRARHCGNELAVLLIDIDRFKLINDALGHHAGDRLLQEMARRLRVAVPGHAIVARMGGDEFLMLLENPGDVDALSRVARQILQELVREYPLEGQLLYVTASIGISKCPQDGWDEYSLIKRADIAMYRAKAAGKNTCAIYSSQMDLCSAAQLSLESDLRHAIEQNGLTLCYQPKINTHDARITGSEVLVRWNHKERGLLNPEDFIPIAEESGLIVPLTRWILRHACSQNQQWARQGRLAPRLAVNLSARQFADGSLLEDVRAVLADTGMEPALLELEITESMMMRDTRHTRQMLAGLKALGVHIALDDFGVAYSSLSHLKRFPIDIIKIDRSFIEGIPGSAADEAITEAILNLSHDLKIAVVAEGVENREQWQFLRNRNCNEIQGFLFSAPLDAQAFGQLLHGSQETALVV